MANKKDGNNRIAVVLITVVVISVIITGIVILLYYVKKNKEEDLEYINKSISVVDISDNRMELLLKHISLMDPLVTNSGLIQLNDLDDDMRIKLVIEDLIYTDKYVKDEDKIVIKSSDILDRALLMFNQKTYDYYPDTVDLYDYHFEKKENSYVGTKGDFVVGEYHYIDITSNVIDGYLYLSAKVSYYENKYGAYTNSNKIVPLCEGEHCIEKVDLSGRALTEVHGLYQIVNNQFVLVSVSSSEGFNE